ncbi:class I SAM-dependent DNA methyltransferase [Deferribacter abyssi]|uniref:class I SAM-dependent DNA methyltransferase n=1 Tax=Deferribacter abyssi TaxID=213806 RepID=UPI003C14AAFF
MSINKFDEIAFIYDCKPMHIERAKTIANAIKIMAPIQKEWKIADFGCGSGLLGLNFINDVRKIDMIDSSKNMLMILEDKIKKLHLVNINLKLMDIFNDNIPTKEYDMIITLMTLHHIKDLKGVIRRFSKMLKLNGYLAIADLDEEDGTYHDDGETAHNGINQDMLIQLTTKSGFKFLKKNTPYIIKKKVDKINKEYPVFLHLYKKE